MARHKIYAAVDRARVPQFAIFKPGSIRIFEAPGLGRLLVRGHPNAGSILERPRV